MNLPGRRERYKNISLVGAYIPTPYGEAYWHQGVEYFGTVFSCPTGNQVCSILQDLLEKIIHYQC